MLSDDMVHLSERVQKHVYKLNQNTQYRTIANPSKATRLGKQPQHKLTTVILSTSSFHKK